MNFIGPDVATICTGMAAYGSGNPCAGKRGKRISLKHMSNDSPTLGGAGGKVSDVMITVEEIKKSHRTHTIISDHSGSLSKRFTKT